MQTLAALAWRNLQTSPLRTLLSALIISLGVAMTIAADLVSTALLSALQEVDSGEAQITHGFLAEQLDLNLKGISAILIAATVFLIFNTFTMSITQRRRQLGLLRALGLTRRQTHHLVLWEALCIATLGTALGLLGGPLLGQGIVALLRALLGDLFAFGAATISLPTLLLAAVLGYAVTLLAAWAPARQATAVSPLAALRDENATPSRMGQTAHRLLLPKAASQRLIALPMLAMFTYLIVAPPGEWATPPWNVRLAVLFVLLWLASCLAAIPWLLRSIARGAQKMWAPSANGRLAADNLCRVPERARLTTLTLAIGVITIVGLTGVMTFIFDDLFGYTFDEMARREMWALFPFDLEQGMADMANMAALALPPEEIAAFLAVVGDRAEVVAIRFASVPELSFMGNSYFTFLVDPAALQSGFFTMQEGDWATAVPLMQSGCGALVAPAVAQRLKVAVGETFTLNGRHGPLPCTLAGVGVGFVNASIVGSGVGEQLTATAVVALVVTPKDHHSLPALLADMQRATANGQGHLTSMRSYADLMEQMVKLVGVALNVMLLLAVVAAALGVVNTMMMNVYERQQEMALLRAVGATKKQVTAVFTKEAVLLGIAGAFFGLLAGAGTVTIYIVTYGGSSWGVPDLAVWSAAGHALQPALRNGLIALLLVPMLSAAAAYWPAKNWLSSRKRVIS